MSIAAMYSRDMNLYILATMASTEETLAYELNRSNDPEMKQWANQIMDHSIQAKRIIKEHTEGWEQKVYLELAEGHA